MAVEFGTGKTICILAIVAGCFAVLWPKLFYPMLQASVNTRNPIDNSQGKTNEWVRSIFKYTSCPKILIALSNRSTNMVKMAKTLQYLKYITSEYEIIVLGAWGLQVVA
jgi:hypothetical protein